MLKPFLLDFSSFGIGRSDRIRTCGLNIPNVGKKCAQSVLICDSRVCVDTHLTPITIVFYHTGKILVQLCNSFFLVLRVEVGID